MSSWHDVNGSLDVSPLRAAPEDFGIAANHFLTVEGNTRTVINEFAALTQGDVSQFDGKAASAFVHTLQDVAAHMRDIPDIADAIAQIFLDHERNLKALRDEVDRALAAALTTRAQRDADKREVGQATTALSSIRSQVAALQSAGTEASDPRLTELRSRESSARWRVGTTQAHLASSEHALNDAVRQFHGFRSREEELNRSTAHRLDGVDLASMADPSNFDKALSWVDDRLTDVGAFFAEFMHDIGSMLVALFKGDWNEFLWRLNDVLRAITTIMTVVAAIAAIVALVVTGGAALPLIAGILAVSAAWTAATSAMLHHNQTINKETGETMSWETLKRDSIDAVVAALSFGVAGWLHHARVAHTAAAKPAFNKMTLSKHWKNDWFKRSVHPSQGAKPSPAMKDVFKRWKLEGVRIQRIDRLDAAPNVAGVPESIDDAHGTAEARRQRLLNASAESWAHDVLVPPYSCYGPTRAVLVATK